MQSIQIVSPEKKGKKGKKKVPLFSAVELVWGGVFQLITANAINTSSRRTSQHNQMEIRVPSSSSSEAATMYRRRSDRTSTIFYGKCQSTRAEQRFLELTFWLSCCLSTKTISLESISLRWTNLFRSLTEAE